MQTRSLAILVADPCNLARLFELSEEFGAQLFIDQERFLRAAAGFRVLLIDAPSPDCVRVVRLAATAAPRAAIAALVPAGDVGIEAALRGAGVVHVAKGRIDPAAVRALIGRSMRSRLEARAVEPLSTLSEERKP